MFAHATHTHIVCCCFGVNHFFVLFFCFCFFWQSKQQQKNAIEPFVRYTDSRSIFIHTVNTCACNTNIATIASQTQCVCTVLRTATHMRDANHHRFPCVNWINWVKHMVYNWFSVYRCFLPSSSSDYCCFCCLLFSFSCISCSHSSDETQVNTSPLRFIIVFGFIVPKKSYSFFCLRYFFYLWRKRWFHLLDFFVCFSLRTSPLFK